MVRTRFAAQSHRLSAHRRRAHRAVLLGLRAASHGGKFILRIEDTDRERSTAGVGAGDPRRACAGCGLDWDEGPFYPDAAPGRAIAKSPSALIARLATPTTATASKEELDAMRAAQTRARREAALRRPLASREREGIVAAAGCRARGPLQEPARRRGESRTIW